MKDFSTLRGSLLAALGLVALGGCGGSSSLETSGAGGGSVGAGCKSPVALKQADGSDSGYVRCADGAIDRVAQVACAAPAPTGPACKGDEQSKACTKDGDCTEGAYGRCVHFEASGGDAPPGSTYCGCHYGCKVDADCAARGSGFVCACGAEGTPVAGTGTCVRASCAKSADCASGECGVGAYDNGCGTSVVVACRTPADSCRVDASCKDQGCSAADPGQPFACQQKGCAIGRPMTIEGVARASSPARRGDWSAAVPVDVAGLAPAVRAALAARWREIAALEHASLGSFARFTIQLLALGAPPELVADAQRASLDEVEHARVAYGLASAFAGEPVGPGPLDGAGAAIPTDAPSFVRALVEEACVGETMGVAEALALAADVRDPALAGVHRRIAADEERHAALAWRTLAWILRRDPALVGVARDAAERAIADLVRGAAADAIEAPEAGLVGRAARADVRRRAAVEVVRPCFEALVAA
jgi:hypothetical protein